MQKSKTKVNKCTKVPKPIKIKKEKSEEDRTPQPMSHYVDDRLELVKQIFGTLKQKTITNLAPDFLKKKDLDEIQEMCLNELLGISTKRLLSVINATKCPTDTESSSDSDVHNMEDHVSLEEISSDSQVEGHSSKSRKKKSKRATKGQIKNCNGKKANEENENDAQISVLELLELQARARAIRSQLALEPVTKIEVNSDDESEKQKPNAKVKDNEMNSKNNRKRNLNDSGLANEASRNDKESRQLAKAVSRESSNGGSKEGLSGNDIKSQSRSADRKFRQQIKIKRNFRNNKECPNDEEENENKNIAKEIKQEKLSRSASPDVIPIVAEPVTLMIGDTSDDDDTGGRRNVLEKSTEAPTARDLNQKKQNENIQNSVINFEGEKTNQGRCNGEPEDGEILEEMATKAAKKTENEHSDIAINNSQAMNAPEFPSVGNVGNVSLENIDKGETSEGVDSVITSENFNAMKMQQTTITNDNMNLKEQQINKSLEEHLSSKSLEHCSVEGPGNVEDDEDDDQNDDVISIEGGDLENEMTEHLQDEACKEKTEVERIKISTICSRDVEDDVISLESSEDDLIKDSAESWNSRWLKSSKVSKVLAASRLGKRVRDNIKKTKRSNNDFSNDEEKSVTKETSSSYASKHEDGSIEQYKELLEIRQQRKT